jgi:hypothetical protein
MLLTHLVEASNITTITKKAEMMLMVVMKRRR